VFEHHTRTIENLKAYFEPNGDYLAFIVNGSVARGDAGEESDVDFYLVVGDSVFDNLSANSATIIEAHEHCVPPCPEANGSLISKTELKRIYDQGNEIERWAFYRAKIIFSKDSELNQLVAAIPRYPEQGRTRRMESYYSQMFYHLSFLEFACYSQTKYLIYETATKMILSIGRLILADNRILYPNRKRFFSELEKVPDKPAGICETMVAFLDEPTIPAGHRLIEMVQNHKTYPVPPEGIKARIAKESLLNLEAW
jgi:hypothetical protein